MRQQSHYILVKGAAMSGMRLRAGGNWITVSNPPGTVIAYENPTQHGGRGINVLYHDGTVAWIEGPKARATVAALQAGKNPPP